MALPKQHRLGSNRDFNRVHRKGLRASTQHLAVRALNIAPAQAYSQKKAQGKAQKKSPPKLKNRPKESAEGSPSALSCAQGTEPSALDIQTTPAAVSPLPALKLSALNLSEPVPSKFGISISKKVSKRAVVRNRIKRQIKAVIHRYLPAIAPGWKVVIVVRPSAVECEFADFLRELEYLLKKLRIKNTGS